MAAGQVETPVITAPPTSMKSHNYEDHGSIENASQDHSKGCHGRRVTAAGINVYEGIMAKVAAGEVTAVEIENNVSSI